MQKNIISAIFSTLFLLISFGAMGQLYNYNLPFEREFGKQKVRSEFISYRTVRQAWSKTKDSLENASILNGTWKTTVTSDTSSAVRTDNVSSWNDIQVPFFKSEKREPVYTPKVLPVMEEPLQMTPSKTFTVFRTDFIIPFDYLDKAIFMHIGGVTNKTTVYVNGKKVALFRESMIPQEVKISDAIQRGKNTLTLVMDPYNEESIMERWDTQFSPSVTGDVFVFAQPKIRMFDFMHKTTLDPTYKNGLLEAALILKTELINTHPVTVYYDLYDNSGKVVSSDYKEVEIGWYKFDTIRFMSSIQNVNLWSAKNPYLYTIVYRVKREGRTYENVIRKVGFRQVEVKGEALLINGEKEPIYGINADLYPELTSSISSYNQKKETMKKLKSNGFNAIRTPYPLNEDFYDIADKLGLYVSETAPICSRGISKSINKGGSLANNPAWSDVYVSRVVDTYEKGKDHSSIIMWEMGEDAGYGCSMDDAYNAIRDLEGYRPIAYADAGYQWISDVCVAAKAHKVLGADKPEIPNRVSYQEDFWKSHQGCFINEIIEGRVSDSPYSMNIGLVDNFQEPKQIEESPNFWDKIKNIGKKGKKATEPKAKKTKVAKTAAVETASNNINNVATTTAVTTASVLGSSSSSVKKSIFGSKTDSNSSNSENKADLEEKPAMSKLEKAQLGKNKEAENVMEIPSVPQTTSADSPVTAKLIEGTTYEIYNGLTKNLNTYKLIHATIDKTGKVTPVELLTINLEPGHTTTITLAKTSKSKESFLLIGGIARIKL